jgi:hypothetical protein
MSATAIMVNAAVEYLCCGSGIDREAMLQVIPTQAHDHFPIQAAEYESSGRGLSCVGSSGLEVIGLFPCRQWIVLEFIGS